MPSRIVLVRHGETEWSRTGQHTGNTDIPLTEAGRQGARQLGSRLQHEPWASALSNAVVCTSPLARASETASLAGFGEQVEQWDALREWDYGDYEGLTTPQIHERHSGWMVWRDGAPHGETVRQLTERADTVVTWALELFGVRGGKPGEVRHEERVARTAAPGRNVLLFGHGHMLRAVAARWMGLDLTAALHLRLSPASVSLLSWEHGVPALGVWNDVAHTEQW